MHPFEDSIIPPDLRLLFVDETAAYAVSESLKSVASGVQIELEGLAAKKTFFQKTLSRFGRTEEPSKLEQDAEKIKTALEICHTIHRNVSAELEKEAEWFLRENYAPYKRSLAAGRLNEDWHRAILSFQESLRHYIRELGQSRNMAVTNYDKVGHQISETARAAIAKATVIAHELVKHTAFVNEVVERQHDLVRDTPVAENFLPRLPLADYVGWTESLPSMDIGPMQSHYDHILNLCETLVGPGILELEAALKEFQELNERANASVVLAFIEKTREKAQADWFNPGTIKQILARLEAKYNTPTMPYTFELAASPV